MRLPTWRKSRSLRLPETVSGVVGDLPSKAACSPGPLPSSTFLRLPVEIRQRVFSFLLPQEALIVCDCISSEVSTPRCVERIFSSESTYQRCMHATPEGVPVPKYRTPTNFHTVIFLVNRQIYREVLELANAQALNSIYACQWSCAFSFFRDLPPLRKATIHHIRFWGPEWGNTRHSSFSGHYTRSSMGLNRVHPFLDLEFEETIIFRPMRGNESLSIVKVDLFFHWKYSLTNFGDVVERIRLQWEGPKKQQEGQSRHAHLERKHLPHIGGIRGIFFNMVLRRLGGV